MQSGVVVMNSHRGPVVHSTPVGTGPSPRHSSSHLPRHTAQEAGEHRCSHPRREAPCTRGKVHSAPCAAGGVSCPSSTLTPRAPLVASPCAYIQACPWACFSTALRLNPVQGPCTEPQQQRQWCANPCRAAGGCHHWQSHQWQPAQHSPAGSSPSSPTCPHLHQSCFRVSKA